MEVIYRKTEELVKLENNPRTITQEQLQKLKESIQSNPDYFEARPIILSDRTGELIIIAGNQRYEACLQLGIKEVPTVLIPNLTEDREREIIIRDNVNNGEWDMALLATWDSDLLTDWGLDLPSDWDAPEEETREANEDDFTEEDAENVEIRVKAGEIWQLGEHRLMCGDSTSEECFEKLMNGEKADIAFTSPPYNLMEGFNTNDKQADGYLRGENAYNEYSDDRTPDDYAQFLTNVLNNCLNNVDDVFFNIGYTKGALIGTAKFIGQNADYFCGAITWVKSGCYMPFFPVQHGMLGNITEPVYIFTNKSGRKLHHPQWKQGETSYNVVETKNATGNDYSKEHAATFPIEFAYEFIKRFSDSTVLDCFGGTGTTLMAAEQLGRKCFMMELDAHYCNIIIARWEKLTGKEAVKIYG